MSTNENYKINPLTRIKLSDPIQIDIFLEKKTLEVDSYKVLKFLGALPDSFSAKQAIELAGSILNIPEDEAKEIFEDYLQCNLFVNSEYKHELMNSVNHWIDRGWLDALILHLASRQIDFDDEKVENPEEEKRKWLRKKFEGKSFEFWKQIPPNKERVSLPAPTDLPSDRSFFDVLVARRTNERWKQPQIGAQDFSNILHYANIETCRERNYAKESFDKGEFEGLLKSSAFSAQETYVLANKIEGLKKGVYHYNPQAHELSLISEGDKRRKVVELCIGQVNPKEASAVILISVIWEAYMRRYQHPRAYRNLLVNSAELMQKYLLLATTYNYAQFITPAFNDRVADELIESNNYKEAPIYALAFG